MYVENKYYKILESSKYDDIETIRRNYKRIIFINHPDRGGDEDFAKEVNIAWKVIKENHIQQKRQSTNQKNNKGSKGKHTKNNSNKTSNTTNKQKTKTKKSYSKNNKQSKCNSKYDKSNEDIELLCIGVVFIGIGLFLLSICWPFGIIYFYLLYKYLSS